MSDHPRQVVHLTTTCEGGAGLAATRLHQALLGIGYPSSVIARYLSTEQLGIPGLKKRSPSIWRAGLSKTVTAADRIIDRGGFSLFTPFSANTIDGLAQVLEPNTVVNVHNAFNFIDWSTIADLRSQGTPVVITLHDQRWFTGGCHYSEQCEGYRGTCEGCPRSPAMLQWSPRRNVRIAIGVTRNFDVAVVSPSRWLATLAEASSVFRGVNVNVIPNPIARDMGLDIIQSLRRQRTSVENMLWVAWLPGKGDQLFQDIIDRLDRRPKGSPAIGIVTTTLSQIVARNIPIKRIPPPRTELDRAKFWSSAHVSTLTTSDDNFPNVVIESLAVGTPMIVPKVGGAHEAVQMTGGGLIVERSSAAFTNALVRLAETPSLLSALSDAALSGAQERFAPDVVAQQYAAIYEMASTQ